MTKILHVPSGQFVYFVSSFRYDRARLTMQDWTGKVLRLEDSFIFEQEANRRLSNEEILNALLNADDGYFLINNQFISFFDLNMLFQIEEFEFIYD